MLARHCGGAVNEGELHIGMLLAVERQRSLQFVQQQACSGRNGDAAREPAVLIGEKSRMPSKLSTSGCASCTSNSPCFVSTTVLPDCRTIATSNSSSNARICCQAAGTDIFKAAATAVNEPTRASSTRARSWRKRSSLK